MAEGIVFATEEFSTFNGPGIRMTFFLKGCPMRCMWCHNPEGQDEKPQMVRQTAGCLHCGACLKEGERVCGRPMLTKESITVCPVGLVRACGEVTDDRKIADMVCKNADLLRKTNGGVTFSGGEPLFQPDFLSDCLKRLAGITHRAVQTSGYCPGEIFDDMVKDTDYFLYDLKLMNEENHRRYTGVSNRLILGNFDRLVKSGKPFCVRIPLIPGVTDTKENLTETASFLDFYGVHTVDVCPYNKMAGGKYALVGWKYQVSFDEQAEPNPRRELFAKYGIEVNVL